MFSNDIYSHLQPYIFFEYRIPNESRDITGKNLSTTSFPPRILLLHLPTSFTDKYGVHEMLHVNEADKRRLMAGSVTIQELSRRSWWTPCLVVRQEFPKDNSTSGYGYCAFMYCTSARMCVYRLNTFYLCVYSCTQYA